MFPSTVGQDLRRVSDFLISIVKIAFITESTGKTGLAQRSLYGINSKAIKEDPVQLEDMGMQFSFQGRFKIWAQVQCALPFHGDVPVYSV